MSKKVTARIGLRLTRIGLRMSKPDMAGAAQITADELEAMEDGVPVDESAYVRLRDALFRMGVRLDAFGWWLPAREEDAAKAREALWPSSP